MPFKKISDLPTGTAQGGELIPATQSGVTRSLTLGVLPGAIPYIDGLLGVRVRGGPNDIAIGGSLTSSAVTASDRWVRFMTINVNSTYSGVAVTALVKYLSAGFSPNLVYAYVRRGAETPPPVPIVSVGLETPFRRDPITPIVTDVAAVETSPGVVEIWLQLASLGSGSHTIAFSVFAAGNAGVTWPTQGDTRTSSPPSPTSGGAFVQWSSSTSRLNTGRIVEAGSGANGSYIRFSDGTQIAQHTISSSSFGSQSGTGTFTDPYLRLAAWTYPAAFSATPVVQVTVESTASGIVVARATTRSATNANIRVEYAANNAAFTANLLAIGRWY